MKISQKNEYQNNEKSLMLELKTKSGKLRKLFAKNVTTKAKQVIGRTWQEGKCQRQTNRCYLEYEDI